MIDIEFSNRQSNFNVDQTRIVEAARAVLHEEGHDNASVSIAVVDDPTIHQLNRQYLNHDYATDVLSFTFSAQGDDRLEGEVIVSADTAATSATDYNWSTDDELLLYVIHGMLHLTGYDDKSDDLREDMRNRERHYLAQFDLQPHDDPTGLSEAEGGAA